MNISWSGSGYELSFESAREFHLVRDSLIEAAYIVDSLPDEECIARYGFSKVGLQKCIDTWNDFSLRRNVDVRELELVKACMFDTLDFFSESDYRMRTGWSKSEARVLFSFLLEKRRAITRSRKR